MLRSCRLCISLLQVARNHQPQRDGAPQQGSRRNKHSLTPPLPSVCWRRRRACPLWPSSRLSSCILLISAGSFQLAVFVTVASNIPCLLSFKAAPFSSLRQKRKLSDTPVEAGEDYTKFNSADFSRKVSVNRAVCASFKLRQFSRSRFSTRCLSDCEGLQSSSLGSAQHKCLSSWNSKKKNKTLAFSQFKLNSAACNKARASSGQRCWPSLLIFLSAAQEDDCCSKKSGQGGQDRHEDHVIFLQPQS